MKTWLDFLPKRTHSLKRKSKMLNALDYDLTETKLKYEYLLKAYKELDMSLRNEALKLNTDEQIDEAMIKAREWNDTPTIELKPVHNEKATRKTPGKKTPENLNTKGSC